MFRVSQLINGVNHPNNQEYKLERSAVAKAIKMRRSEQKEINVLNESFEIIRIIVIKKGLIYAGYPKDWEKLKAEGYTR